MKERPCSLTRRACARRAVWAALLAACTATACGGVDVAWTTVPPDGGPAPRGYCDARSVWDGARGRMLMYTGFDEAENLLTDVWALETSRSAGVARWSLVAPDAPPPARLAPAWLFRDATRRALLLYGETFDEDGGTSYPPDAWWWDADSAADAGAAVWSTAAVSPAEGSGPGGGRAWFDAVWLDDAQTRALVVGGIDSRDFSLNSTVVVTLPVEGDGSNATAELVPATAGSAPPPGIEGHRISRVGGSVYLFGGYLCVEEGQLSRGGFDCFNPYVYVLDVATLVWSRIEASRSSAEYAPPTGVMYHTQHVVGDDLLVVVGGAYLDITSVFLYLNDVHAFNVTSRQWVPVTVRGQPPAVAWSRTSVAVPPEDPGESCGEVWVFGGCGSATLDTVHVLLAGVELGATNLNVSGAALAAGVVAGEETTVRVEARDSQGRPLDWAGGLAVEAIVLSQALQLVPTRVADAGGGAYNVSFTPGGGGDEVALYVQLDGADAPGSPFTMRKVPGEPYAPLSSVSGAGISAAVCGRTSSVTVQLADSFGNEHRAGGRAGLVSLLVDGEPAAGTAVRDLGDGRYEASHLVPDRSSFLLSVLVGGEDVRGSPLQVRTLDPLEVPRGTEVAMQVVGAAASAVVLALALALVRLWSTPAVRASTPALVLVALAGTLAALAGVFLPAQPTDSSCLADKWLLLLAVPLVMTSLVAKNHRILAIFEGKSLSNRRRITDAHLLAAVAAVTACTAAVVAVWSATDPPRAVEVRASTNALLTYVTCRSDNWTLWHASALLPSLLVCLAGVHVALLTSDVPPAFNEAKMLGLAVYNVAFTTLVTVPLVAYSGDSPSAVYVAKRTAVVWAAVFTAAALCLPKLRGGAAASCTGTGGTAGAAGASGPVRALDPMAPGLHFSPGVLPRNRLTRDAQPPPAARDPPAHSSSEEVIMGGHSPRGQGNGEDGGKAALPAVHEL